MNNGLYVGHDLRLLEYRRQGRARQGLVHWSRSES